MSIIKEALGSKVQERFSGFVLEVKDTCQISSVKGNLSLVKK